MISISNSPCFASEPRACVHAITALQVVLRPASWKKKRKPLCMFVYAGVPLFVVRSSPKGSDLFTKLRVSRQDSIVYKCSIIINFSVFVVFRFDLRRESQANGWIRILPPENPQKITF